MDSLERFPASWDSLWLLGQDVVDLLESQAKQKLIDIFHDVSLDKSARDHAVKTLKAQVLSTVKNDMPMTAEAEAYCVRALDHVAKDTLRSLTLNGSVR